MILSCPFVGLLVCPTLHGDLREDLGDQSEYLGDQRGTLGCQREDLSVDREYLKKLCNLKLITESPKILNTCHIIQKVWVAATPRQATSST